MQKLEFCVDMENGDDLSTKDGGTQAKVASETAKGDILIPRPDDKSADVENSFLFTNRSIQLEASSASAPDRGACVRRGTAMGVRDDNCIGSGETIRKEDIQMSHSVDFGVPQPYSYDSVARVGAQMSLPGAFPVQGAMPTRLSSETQSAVSTENLEATFHVVEATISTQSERAEMQLERLRHLASVAPLVEVLPYRQRRHCSAEANETPKHECPLRWNLLMMACAFMSIAVGSTVIVAILLRFRLGLFQAAVDVDVDVDVITISDRFKRLSKMVVAVSSLEALFDPLSPHHAALSWLANEDELISTHEQDRDVELVIQRYIVALFYFSTGGSAWAGNNLSRTASVHCRAYGNTCLEDYEDIDMQRMNVVPFLSADMHECSWEGIKCYNDSNDVGAITISKKHLPLFPHVYEFILTP